MEYSAYESICGILNIDKPSWRTSHDIVAAVRRWSGQRKVGHAGTLDPMATGVLLVCLGSATRMVEYLMDSRKVYLAGILLGISTTTDDTEGEMVRQAEVNVTPDEVQEALRRFVGRIRQVPPSYSAIKRQGRRLYELARRGVQVQAPPREIEIYALRAIELALPLVLVEVHCGPGTYIRALARDLGEALGCGAHLCSLRRTQSGRFTAENAVSLEQLEEAFATGSVGRFLLPADAALADWPALYLDAATARRLAMGQQVAQVSATQQDVVSENIRARAYTPDGRFVAVLSRGRDTGFWRPEKVFIQPEDILIDQQAGIGNARIE